jgi:excisionase family DNA binding protein
MTQPILFTKKEAAHILKICERTVDKLVSNGRLRSTKIGRRRLFAEQHLNELIKNGEI